MAKGSLSASQKSVVEFQDITVSYGCDAPVIERVSLSVSAGECFGLAGLNGAGKTTMIKVMLGLHDSDEGAVKVLGGDFNAPDICKRVAYLPERFEPPWFLSGLEFLKFTLSLYKKVWDEHGVMGRAEKLGLNKEILKRRTQTYSKGMRQKLGLLATMSAGCDFLVLDEPMSGLDPLARVQVKTLLGEMKKQGVTIFFSSHILADMQEICTNMAVLCGGKITAQGSPQEIIKNAGADNLENAFLHYVGNVEKRDAA